MKKQGDIFKRIMDSRLAWDLFQGPIYNRAIWNAAGPIVEDVIERTRPPRPDAMVLDVGAGPGLATILAAKKHPAATVIGVDYSPEQVRAARRNLRKDPAPNCSFRIGDAMELPFEDNTFDLVISIASLKHWPDGARGLGEIFRVLKPGCEAHVGEADRECDRGDLEKFIAAFSSAWWMNKQVIGWYLRGTVFGQSYSRAEAEAMAREAGFGDVAVEKVPGAPAFRITMKKERV